MNYLINLGFTSDELNTIINNNDELVVERLNNKEALVTSNINFLKNLGVENYKDAVLNFTEFFLQDNDVFENIFSKYDRDDLIAKLKKNIGIIVRL